MTNTIYGLTIALAFGVGGSACAFDLVIDQVFIELDGAMPAGNVEAQVVAMATQLKPHLIVELSFAKRAAELNDDQVKKLVDASREGWLKCAKDAVGGNQMQGNAIFFGNGRAIRQASGDVYSQLTDIVAKALAKVADVDQIASYKKEVAARQEFRKQATIDEIVAMLDEGLLLHDEQRAKIRESLEAKWQDDWAGNMEALQQYGDQYYPTLPNAVVVPHLTNEQQSRWNSLQKVNASIGFGSNMFGAQAIGDIEVADAEPPKDAAGAAPAPDGVLHLQQLIPAVQAAAEAGEAAAEE